MKPEFKEFVAIVRNLLVGRGTCVFFRQFSAPTHFPDGTPIAPGWWYLNKLDLTGMLLEVVPAEKWAGELPRLVKDEQTEKENFLKVCDEYLAKD